MKCLQCESERIVKNVRALDCGDSNMKLDLRIEVYDNPDAWIFKGAVGGTLKANVCVDCGFVMVAVSTADAQKLERYQKKSPSDLSTDFDQTR